jgi:6-phosphogluconolactonase
VAFSPDGRTLYCANELDSTLAVFSYDAESGALASRQVLSTRPAGAQGENAPADLHVHPSGRAVYLSNRGDNTIAVFEVNAQTGSLALVQTITSGGDWPRNFVLTPDGAGLLVAHQRSDSVVAFRIDERTQQLTKTEERLTTPVPVCLLFA